MVFGCVSKGVKLLFSYFICMKDTSTAVVDAKMACLVEAGTWKRSSEFLQWKCDVNPLASRYKNEDINGW